MEESEVKGSNDRLRPDDSHESQENQPVEPEKIPIEVVYEDNYLVVVNKPAGMVMHPAYKHKSRTLANALVFRYQNLPYIPGHQEQPGLVHRLDRGTSGLIVVAKTTPVMKDLTNQFYRKVSKRTYQALVWGIPSPSNDTIDINLGRIEGDSHTIVFPDGTSGKTAITHYRLIEDFKYASLVECTLETGRTHQIRAHMKYIGHILFNDILYEGHKILFGPKDDNSYCVFVKSCFKIMKSQALHAKTLGFTHPITKEVMLFESTLPKDFQKVINKWRNFSHHCKE